MIGKALATYKKIQMDMIGKLSIDNEEVIYECPFLDEGYINAHIERLKLKYGDLQQELKVSCELNTDYEIQKRDEIKRQILDVEESMITYAVNSFKALELCRSLAKGKKLRIELLMDALDNYNKGAKDAAFDLFNHYFAESDITRGYFLGNKIYGHLLIDKGDYEKGLLHLVYAASLRVNDIELLIWLKEAYKMNGMDFESERVEDVLEVLQ
ncbi:hypothetical protein [Pseudobutyrivibrio xylanivorans]|uniref:Uncharacterized protein n=1 Tax=Pseudobutyrivibrio xylanivorans TaxID=185007 RepID=A0A5P6VPL4_PSEXY|nr:hypothetical protein [Pseudobutyrivibrio xylanivorans]QFJ54342.1 hypothetical protein FXF36_05475 [Pseudobutyrivibrio xylanivorans]